MTAVFITVYRQRTKPRIYEERLVQGQINQIIAAAAAAATAASVVVVVVVVEVVYF